MTRAGAQVVAAVIAGLSPAIAGPAPTTESILPPGMRTLMIVDLKREPDVRCVVPNCFAPPARRRWESQRRFERRLLSPKGPPGRLE